MIVLLVGLGVVFLLTAEITSWIHRTLPPVPPSSSAQRPVSGLIDPYPPDVTYRAVADGLSAGIRESIELSLPCRQAADGKHAWLWEYADSGTLGRTSYRIDHWWECAYCGTTTSSDPRPLDSFARRHVPDLPNAFEIAEMFTPRSHR